MGPWGIHLFVIGFKTFFQEIVAEICCEGMNVIIVQFDMTLVVGSDLEVPSLFQPNTAIVTVIGHDIILIATAGTMVHFLLGRHGQEFTFLTLD